MSGKYATKVVKIRRKDGEVVQDCEIYIGRRLTMGGWNLPESIWHNPFEIKKYKSREVVLKMYRDYLTTNKKLMALLPTIYGRVIGCWCAPEPCHGDIIAELAEIDHRNRAKPKTKPDEETSDLPVPVYDLTDEEVDELLGDL